ncbi:MAG TPA: type II toxin-antitoxin system Phd/YefM family antitoxin [Polyangiaceae bacterium]
MTMSDWSIADAKARFSELVLQVRESPQRVTKRGHGVAVVIAPEEYARLLRATERGEHQPMRAFLEAAEGIRAGDDLGLSLPRRGRARGRPDPFGGKR